MKYTVILLVVFFLMLFSITSPVFSQTQMQPNGVSSAFSKSSELRVKLHMLFHEHTVMAGMMLSDLYKGENISRMEQLMMQNSNSIVEVIDMYYGRQTADKFGNLWRQHIAEYRNYTNALKNNDTNRVNQARERLRTISNQVNDLFPAQGITTSIGTFMNEHVSGTISLIDALAQNDRAQKAILFKQNYDQAGRFADALARMILIDNPNEFK